MSQKYEQVQKDFETSLKLRARQTTYAQLKDPQMWKKATTETAIAISLVFALHAGLNYTTPAIEKYFTAAVDTVFGKGTAASMSDCLVGSYQKPPCF